MNIAPLSMIRGSMCPNTSSVTTPYSAAQARMKTHSSPRWSSGIVLDVDREHRVVERRGDGRVELVELGVGEVVLLPDLDQQVVEVVAGRRRGEQLAAHARRRRRSGWRRPARTRAGCACAHRRNATAASTSRPRRVVVGYPLGGLGRNRRSRPCRSRRRPGRPAPGSWRRSGTAPARSAPSARPPPAATARRPSASRSRETLTISSYVASRWRSRASWSSAVDTWVTRVLPDFA